MHKSARSRRNRALSRAGTGSLASLRSAKSLFSIMSLRCVGSIMSFGSVLSIGSAGSLLSIGSAGSILSIGSVGSILSIGGAGSRPGADRDEPEERKGVFRGGGAGKSGGYGVGTGKLALLTPALLRAGIGL